MRACATVNITFGLVHIPVKLYLACSSNQVQFNMLTKDGHRVGMSFKDKVTGEEVNRADLDSGYEFAKDQYVRFTKEELDALKTDRSKIVEIGEFVDADSVDLLQVEKSYYVGPDKGAAKAYSLLAQVLREKNQMAVAQLTNSGKEHLVVIRPYRDGLLMHQMFYADEVRDFGELDIVEAAVSPAEMDLASKLVDTLSTGAFDPSKYRDRYAERVLKAVDQKVSGQEVAILPDAPQASIQDIFEALQASIDKSAKSAKTVAKEPKTSTPKKGKRGSKSRDARA